MGFAKPDLYIEVLHHGVLKGLVRYVKDFAIDNIPTIAAFFRCNKNSTFQNKSGNGKSVFKLEFVCEPYIVSDFLAGIGMQDLNVNSSNAMDYHNLSDFLQCAEITKK